MRAFRNTVAAGTLIGVVTACFAIWTGVTRATDEDAVSRLAEGLASDRYAEREAAELKLVQLGHDAVPRLRELLESTDDAEVRARLRRAIGRITTLRWHRDLVTAMARAKSNGKSVLVFSTIGELDGYS
jgi:HEAT repeat protein